MARKALFLVPLALVAVWIVTLVRAQDVPSGNRQEPRPFPGVVPVSNREPAATDTPRLAERLQALRSSAAPAADKDASHGDSGGTWQPSDTMRSVLKRGPEPDTNAPSRIISSPAQESAAGESGSATDESESSRRTARAPRGLRSPPRSTVSSIPTGTDPAMSLRSQGPALRVDARGPKALQVGRDARYRVTLSNDSEAAAEEVVVRVTLPTGVKTANTATTLGEASLETAPQGLQVLVWRLAQVPGRSEHSLMFDLSAANHQPVEMTLDWMVKAPTQTVRLEVQEPKLEMHIAGPRELKYGESHVYRLTVSNPGTGRADNVKVSIVSAAKGSEPQPIGNLAAGETRELEMQLTARQAGAMQLRATADGDGGLHTEATQDIVVRRAKLDTELTGPAQGYAGAQANYQLRISNSGDAPADNLIVQLRLPPGLRPLQADGRAATGQDLAIKLPTLAAGAQRMVNLTCELVQAGSMQIVAQVRGDDQLSATSNCTTQVDALADLKMAVNDPTGPQVVGRDVLYEIQLVNRGTKAARNVRVAVQFSNGVEPQSATGQRAEIVTGQVLFQPVTSIEAGATLTLKVVARASQAGSRQFRVEVKGDDADTQLVAQGTTRFVGPASSASNGGRTIR